MKSFCTRVCVARFIHVEERSLGRGEENWDAVECRDHLEMIAQDSTNLAVSSSLLFEHVTDAS